ncbi:sulfurtransferase complex subunit TusB [Buchnera aphidicola]|uniref:sulfurtransferase complex subunit TusB n=1 Tax=Buchnera aphidicola TaxID=9 RepID=UPI002237C997|nr:sulfurtransferase complex subunit TusB [Buchnera aphidicola]MCW5197474.1 sulfurtransferase complex subunit TusB [Buchnera aphidicola (Chaitophorus viminalis)]
MLHTFINSPFKSDFLLFSTIISKKDAVVLLQDGVLLALKNNYFLQKKYFYFKNNYVLVNDLKARGILNSKVSNLFNPINYIDFVDLTEIHKQQIIW